MIIFKCSNRSLLNKKLKLERERAKKKKFLSSSFLPSPVETPTLSSIYLFHSSFLSLHLIPSSFLFYLFLFLFLFFKRRKKEKKKGVSGNDGDMPWSLLVPGPIIIKDVTTDQVDCHVHPFFFFLQFEKNKIKLRKIKEKRRKGLIGKKVRNSIHVWFNKIKILRYLFYPYQR